MTPFCAAVDWGTSSFRLWLLAEDGTALAERRSDEGMIQAAATGFGSVLESHLSALGADTGLPAVICGMAGARQGWREAGYLDTPADLRAVATHALRVDDAPRDVRILPGIAHRNAEAPDVMRGEETQLLGLLAERIRNALVCMPGTHSKWVQVKDGKVTAFTTAMTGELFALLSRHSILSATMEGAAPVEPGSPVFLDAARQAFARPQTISSLIFQIRSGQLLGFAPQSDGAARLSGFLIGLELAGALAQFGPAGGVALLASGRMATLYRAVLEAEHIAVRLCDAEAAARAGLLSAAHTFWANGGELGDDGL